MRIQEQPNDVLTVRPFDNQLKGDRSLHPDLPQPPFTTLLVGPKGSGKSNVILRMIYGNKKTPKCNPDNKHYKFYRHFFDKIMIFSSTWTLDPKTTRCRIPDDQIFDDPDDYVEIIEEIVKGQEEDIQEDGKENADHILLVFSDLAGTRLFSNSRGILNRLAFNHRHLKISSLIDTQSLRQINNAFRNNLSAVLLFAGISNRLEIKKIKEEFLGKYTDEEARKIMKYAFDGSGFDFLYVNFQKRGALYKNFNSLLIQDDADSDTD